MRNLGRGLFLAGVLGLATGCQGSNSSSSSAASAAQPAAQSPPVATTAPASTVKPTTPTTPTTPPAPVTSAAPTTPTSPPATFILTKTLPKPQVAPVTSSAPVSSAPVTSSSAPASPPAPPAPPATAQAVTVTATGTVSNWLFVGNYGSSTVTVFALDATGAPSLPATSDMPLAAGAAPTGLAMDPTGTLLFAACPGNSTSSWTSSLVPIVLSGSGSTLTLTPGTPQPTSSSTQAVCVDPAAGSNMVYTADYGGTISCFPYTSAGVLAAFLMPASGQTINAGSAGGGGGPCSLVIDPVGQNLYTAVNADESLYCLTLSAAGIGTFDPNNYAYCAGAGNGPTSVAINPAGTYVYAGNGNADGALSSFQVQSGSLNPTSIGGGNGFIMASATGTNVTGVAVDPTGRFLAAAINDTDEVGLYTLDSGGNITPAGNTVVVAAGAGPTQVIFHPTLKALYASNQGTNTISAFSFTASGLTQLTGPGLAIPASDSGPGALAIR